MAKKSFSKGIDAIFGDSFNQEEIQSPKKEFEKEELESSEKGIETRTTIVLEEDLMEKLKAVAFWERLKFKDVVKNAINLYLGSKEEKTIDEALNNFRQHHKK